MRPGQALDPEALTVKMTCFNADGTIFIVAVVAVAPKVAR
jgi:hypothetical protein